MDFSSTPLTLNTPSLEIDYFQVPWDSEILARPVAQIRRLEVRDEAAADQDFRFFRLWLDSGHIEFCSCRVAHDRLSESQLLQRHGFCFIELNYRPVMQDLQALEISPGTIEILPAVEADQEQLVQMAGSVFEHGRFHQDPKLGADLGNKRYSTWMRNSFLVDSQTTFKCVSEGQVVAFFVVEYGQNSRCFWSLIGLAPGMGGKGIGTRVWQAMMNFHKEEGMAQIETSISSHNTAVFNLYVKLGFRFPLPSATFHWHRE